MSTGSLISLIVTTVIGVPSILPQTTENQQKILDAWNGQRAYIAEEWGASNMNELFWDKALSSAAQDKANTCTHGGISTIKDSFLSYRSNISLGSTWALPTDSSNIRIGQLNYYAPGRTFDTGANWFVNLIQQHAYAPADNVYFYETCCGAGSGPIYPFERLHDASIRYVGCGWEECSLSSDVGTTEGWQEDGIYLYCISFNPMQSGEYPWIQGTICNDCDGDRTQCTGYNSATCGGCMSSTWYSLNGTTPDICTNLETIYPSGSSTTSAEPSGSPSKAPITPDPSANPTNHPSASPIPNPTVSPIVVGSPTTSPITSDPSESPSEIPTGSPNYVAPSPSSAPFGTGEADSPTIVGNPSNSDGNQGINSNIWFI